MQRRLSLLCGVLVLQASAVSGTLNAEPAAVAPPTHVAAAICSPEFRTVQGRLAAGTAFVVRWPASERSQALLVTAHHLFGPDGGLPKQVTWQELPTFVRSVRCVQLSTKASVLEAGPPVPVRDAQAYSERGAAGDVAVFRLAASKMVSLEFRRAEPVLKRPVWLAARVAGGEPPEKLLHRATLVTVDREWIEFAYDNSSLNLTATSGAPIVDEEGRVVGINIGVKMQGKKLIGLAQSAKVALGAVERSLGAAAQPGVTADGAAPRR
jgi:Trypsin-like peptidase domain